MEVTYAALTDPVVSASLTLGIYDHDSSASGSQLALFTVDGNDLTATLDTQFEAGGGSLDLEYNVYSVDLTGLFGDLTDGMVSVVLNLDGPGLVTPLFPLPGPNPPEETDTNGDRSARFPKAPGGSPPRCAGPVAPAGF